MRLVLDTCIIVAALRGANGVSRQVFRAALQQQRCSMLLSVPLMLEYESVLTRQEHLLASGLSLAEMQEVLDTLVQKAERVRLNYRLRPAAADPNDDLVLEAAVNGVADALVTLNQRDFRSAAIRFGLPLWSPVTAWEEICSR